VIGASRFIIVPYLWNDHPGVSPVFNRLSPIREIVYIKFTFKHYL